MSCTFPRGRTFGDRLRSALRSKRVSQRELAARIGVTEAAVSRYIKGDRFPRADTAAAIADVLSVHTDELLYGTPVDPTIAHEEISAALEILRARQSELSDEYKRELVGLLLGIPSPTEDAPRRIQ